MTGLTPELQKALDEANYRATLTNQREALRAKTINNLTLAYGGGLFKVTPELISFVNIRQFDPMILMDINENPILIDDPDGFYSDLTDIYQEAMNEYHAEYLKLSKARTATAVVE